MIHVVYTHGGDRVATPWVIGNKLIDLLGRLDDVTAWQWDDDVSISAGLIVGQPGPHKHCIWQQSSARTKIAVFPLNGSPNDLHYLGTFADEAQHLFAFCGPYWRRLFPAKWRHKTTFLDLAAELPQVKHGFAPLGQRRVLYVGCCEPVKGTWYLEQIVAAMPHLHFGHVGHGAVNGTHRYGYLSTQQLLELAPSYDFTINCGVHDANPTTVIEAAAMGLIPLATPQCGWERPATHIPLYNVPAAVDVISEIVYSHDSRLIQLQTDNRKLAEEQTWEVVLSPIVQEVARCIPQQESTTAAISSSPKQSA